MVILWILIIFLNVIFENSKNNVINNVKNKEEVGNIFQTIMLFYLNFDSN